jgi:RimJ/RimL family protein N-acetyltransferase
MPSRLVPAGTPRWPTPPAFHWTEAEATVVIPTLTTDRLVLRPFTDGDLESLIPLHAEESFWWYPLRRGMTPEESATFLERVIARYDEDGFGLEAVIERSTGNLIGWAGLAVPHFLPEVLPSVEVGWRLGPAARGRGLATEAGAAAVRYGFTDVGLNRIVSIYEPENVPSGKVMEHLGFTRFLTTHGPDGELLDVTELTRDRWEALGAHG